MRFPCFVLLISASLAAPALAQSTDRPLGDILDAIDEPAPPALVPAPRPVPTPPPPADGIEPADLPASIIPAPDARRPGSPFGAPTPGTPPTADDLLVETEVDADVAIGFEEPPVDAVETPPEPEADVLFSAEARLAAEAEAREAARLAEADRRMAERATATARAQEQRMIAHQEEVVAAEAALAQAAADDQAALEANRAEVARQRAAWEARVIACQAGDKTQCAQPGE